MGELTTKQLCALRWFEENDSHKSAWVGADRNDTRKGPDTWSHFKVSGRDGSILVAKEDLRVLNPYMTIMPMLTKMYGVNDAGRALLTPSPDTVRKLEDVG